MHANIGDDTSDVTGASSELIHDLARGVLVIETDGQIKKMFVGSLS